MSLMQTLDFDPALMVQEYRVVLAQDAVRDPFNGHIVRHRAEVITPERLPQLRASLREEMDVPHPSYFENAARREITNAFFEIVPLDAGASTKIVTPPDQKPLKSDPWLMPFQHLANGEPFPTVFSEQNRLGLRDATNIYLLLEHYATAVGNPGALQEAYATLAESGITAPSPLQIGTQLQQLTGVSGQELVNVISQNGVDGVVTLLGIDPGYAKDVAGIAEYMSKHQFALNDVMNWILGRAEPGMASASAENKIDAGLAVRPDMTINWMQQQAQQMTYPVDREQEMHIARIMDLLPPVVSNLYFETNGQIIVTGAPNLDGVLEDERAKNATGFYDYLNVRDVNSVYVSNPSDFKEIERIVVHEISHDIFPEKFTDSDAILGDKLLHADAGRMERLLEFMDTYHGAISAGNTGQAQAILEQLSRNQTKEGMTFERAMGGSYTPEKIAKFTEILEEATDWLAMYSPGYEGTAGYSEPVIRFKELIPRWAELRYAEHPEYKDMLAFIAPGMTELYRDIYLPHIEETLQDVYNERGSKAQAMMYAAELDQYQIIGNSPVMVHPNEFKIPVTLPDTPAVKDEQDQPRTFVGIPGNYVAARERIAEGQLEPHATEIRSY